MWAELRPIVGWPNALAVKQTSDKRSNLRSRKFSPIVWQLWLSTLNCTEHPREGAALQGFQVPFWERIFSVAMFGHTQLGVSLCPRPSKRKCVIWLLWLLIVKYMHSGPKVGSFIPCKLATSRINSQFVYDSASSSGWIASLCRTCHLPCSGNLIGSFFWRWMEILSFVNWEMWAKELPEDPHNSDIVHFLHASSISRRLRYESASCQYLAL